MKKKFYHLLLFVVLTACQVSSPTSVSTLSPTIPPATATPTAALTATTRASLPTATSMPSVTPASTPVQSSLPPFTIDWTKPFAGELWPDYTISLPAWTPQPYAGEDIRLPLDLHQIANPQVLNGLTTEQKAFLAQNGFVVIHSQEAQFGDIRVETTGRTGQPYYLTTDAAFHALHLLFDDLLKALEREYFRPQMIAITQTSLDQVRTYLAEVQGTSLEVETRQALAYLSVAQKLLDPEASVDPAVVDMVSQQVDQIMAAGGRARSVIFPDFEDDYGAYKPVGHYAGDPDLEAYFRAMTWYGRVHFLLADPENPAFVPSRLPLLITLALRRAQIDGQPASDVWAALHETLTFVIGPSDDAGPLEYAALMDQVYGDNPGIQDLADDALWQDFLAHSDQLPAPQINSLFVASTLNLAPEKGWRFMGQRFTLDGLIFQNVIFDRVQALTDGTRRELPSGLDVMAAFGSLPALQELENQGATSFPNYSDQMATMQQAVQAQPEAQWLGRFYDGWLYSFLPILQPKDIAFPAYMQTTAWSYKDMNAALGSWAELKHDTILYTKMPEGAGGGGPPMSGPAPSYVEPNPLAFYRMAYIAQTLSCGLQNLVLHDLCYPGGGSWGADAISFIYGMSGLGARFEALGAIAEKELAGQPLTPMDNGEITDCLGMIECMNTYTGYNRPNSEMPEVPVIAAVSGAQENVLEVGVGGIDRIYVVLPLEGQWEVAQGGIFSYYEFAQPRDQRLSDDEWRQLLANGEQALPAWAANFVLTGGQPTESLFFRIGDVYIITEAGDGLNVRQEPSINSAVIMQLSPGEYVEIIDGPVQMDGFTWWKFQIDAWFSDTFPTGWAVENLEWFTRSYLP
jgi:Protein of unknown function (DUF3160)/Bacterial SH3 domain